MGSSFTSKMKELEGAKRDYDTLKRKLAECKEILQYMENDKAVPRIELSRHIGALKEDECYTLRAEVKVITEEQFEVIKEMLITTASDFKKEMKLIEEKYDLE